LVKAIWNDTVLAESNNCHIVEGNYYFPPEDVKKEYLQSSDTRSVCPWKGETSYYSLQVNEEINDDAAWYYPDPKDAASQIKDHVAFYGMKGIEFRDE